MTSKKNVFVIGATNRPEQLDPALCRPGRLDSLIYVPLPDEPGRLSILKAQLRKTPMAADIDLGYIASKTHGFSGADLGFITQRAVKIAIKEDIALDIERTKAREAAGEEDMDMDDENVEDPVPELTKAHFEEAMSMARKSVSDVEIRRYEAFSQQMKNAGPGAFFKFPDGAEGENSGNGGNFGDAGNDDDLYD